MQKTLAINTLDNKSPHLKLMYMTTKDKSKSNDFISILNNESTPRSLKM